MQRRQDDNGVVNKVSSSMGELFEAMAVISNANDFVSKSEFQARDDAVSNAPEKDLVPADVKEISPE